MTMDLTFQLALGLVAFFGGIWVKRLQDDNNKLHGAIEKIREDYLRRSESKQDTAILKEFIGDIKVRLERIENKLDKKADK